MECASDKLWGNGFPLQDPTCLDPTKPQGIMGQILESIRSEVSPAHFHSYYPSQPPLGTTCPELSSSVTPNNDVSDSNVPNPGTSQSNPQPIPEVTRTNSFQQLDTGGNQSSASTTPVSDTTATETDRSEEMMDVVTDQEPATSNDES